MKQKKTQRESVVLIRTPYQLVAVMHQVVCQPPIKNIKKEEEEEEAGVGRSSVEQEVQ